MLTNHVAVHTTILLQSRPWLFHTTNPTPPPPSLQETHSWSLKVPQSLPPGHAPTTTSSQESRICWQPSRTRTTSASKWGPSSCDTPYWRSRVTYSWPRPSIIDSSPSTTSRPIIRRAATGLTATTTDAAASFTKSKRAQWQWSRLESCSKCYHSESVYTRSTTAWHRTITSGASSILPFSWQPTKHTVTPTTTWNDKSTNASTRNADSANSSTRNADSASSATRNADSANASTRNADSTNVSIRTADSASTATRNADSAITGNANSAINGSHD